MSRKDERRSVSTKTEDSTAAMVACSKTTRATIEGGGVRHSPLGPSYLSFGLLVLTLEEFHAVESLQKWLVRLQIWMTKQISKKARDDQSYRKVQYRRDNRFRTLSYID